MQHRRLKLVHMDEDKVLPFTAKILPETSRVRGNVVSDRDLERIRQLRRIAQKSMLHSRAELDQACLVIAGSRKESIESIGLALFGALGRYASQRLIMHNQFASSVSESEIWLSRMISSFETADTAEGRALVTWRIRPAGHRRVRFLAGLLADEFQQAEKKSPGQ
ncbi:MAG: hypothetical protein KTR19_11185 [Hyphomicrobiales bacterium]|nr:hypothetical protein [Hyphomicrobiales bacterium]